MIDKLTPPFLDQHAADLISPGEYKMLPNAKRFENWEQNFAGKAGLGVAIDYALELGIESIQNRVYMLADKLRNGLSEIDGIELTDLGKEKCGIVTFRAAQASCKSIKTRLQKHRINVTVSDGSGSLVSFQDRGIIDVVRASVHYFNTEEEVSYFLKALETSI